MLNDHTTIRSTAVFDLVGPPNPPVPVQVEMRYDTRDPYAVQAAFRTGRAGWVEWVFSRDLLTEGLITAAGAGDVRIRPSRRQPRGLGVPHPHPRDRGPGRRGRLAGPGARTGPAALQRPELATPPGASGAPDAVLSFTSARAGNKIEPVGHMRT
jgi:hypothetical protein